MTEAHEMERALEKGRRERAEFIARVRNEEAHANRDPAGYRRKVFGLMAVAYGYIFGVLVAAILLLILVIYLMVRAGRGDSGLGRVVVFLGIFVLVVLRSLWVKIKPPDGVVLRRGDVSRLYREVDEIAGRLGAPKPHEIRIDYRFNAAAAQTPRLGMFGFYRNTLLLGLPLLLSMPPDEVRAVIAHEFGHFSGAHGKFGAWAYRVNQTWMQLSHHFTRSGVAGGWLFAGFVRWFQPRFSATTFALRRANEFEADKAAAEIAGAENAVYGLMRLKVMGHHLAENFWRKLGDRAKESATIPPHSFDLMAETARSSPEAATAECQLTRALAEKTGYDDTHPCLSERLRALDMDPALIEDSMKALLVPVKISAADEFLGPRLPSLISQVEQFYADKVKEQWQKKHETHQRAIATIDKLTARSQTMPLTEIERVDLAFQTLVSGDKESAEPMFRELRKDFPDNARVAYWLGAILAEREDREAEPLLRDAISRDQKLAPSGLNLLAQLHRAHGQHDKLEGLEEEAAEARRSRQFVDAHARQVRITDRFQPHGLTYEQVSELVSQLQNVPNIDRVYLVRKLLPNGETRLILLAMHKRKLLEAQNEAKSLQAGLVKLVYPEGTTVYVPAKEQKAWQRCIESVPNSRIFGSS